MILEREHNLIIIIDQFEFLLYLISPISFMAQPSFIPCSFTSHPHHSKELWKVILGSHV